MSLGLWVSSMLHAEPYPPLNVAAVAFTPPFVIQAANKQFYGFDISIVEYVCKSMRRTCTYQPMDFENILPSVENNTADIGIGAITITLDRSKHVAFSIPYLLSYAQYLGLKGNHPEPFSTKEMAGKKIGVEAGSVFTKAIDELNLSNTKIIEFKKINTLIQALLDKSIDYALMDASAARYWQNESQDRMLAYGHPFLYGYGLGIAVSLHHPDLLEDVNTALLEYQNNGGFQKAYNEYIAQF